MVCLPDPYISVDVMTLYQKVSSARIECHNPVFLFTVRKNNVVMKAKKASKNKRKKS